ncbi:hypothetical protein D9M69_523060 [compost metagenome]
MARCWRLMSCTAAAISIAACTASAAWPGVSMGAPQKAMTQSPMYLSTVPRCALITSVSRLKTVFRKACSSAGAICSDSRVKSRISQNITVISLLSARML